MTAFLRCRGLVWRSGEARVLDGLDLDLQHGESLALLGTSGCGKSTLLRIITGLELPERGDVFLGGQLATQDGRLLLPPHRRQTAMLFQDLALWPNLTAAGNVALGMSGLRLSRRTVRGRVEAALETCGIHELASRLPGTLSGGQQQRVALARALSMQPQLLLLDEPFGGLDLITKQALIRELSRLKKRFGFALILVTHDPTEMRVLCNAFCVLEAGRIIERHAVGTSGPAAQSELARLVIQRIPDEPDGRIRENSEGSC